MQETYGVVLVLAALFLVTWADGAYGARVDIEAEDWTACSEEVADANAAAEKIYSNGRTLALSSDTTIRLTYRFEIPESGRYTLRVREAPPNGRSPVAWRVDGGPWKHVKQGWGLVQTARIEGMVYSEWGQAEISRGRHVLEIETTGPVMRREPVKGGSQWYSSAGVMEPTGHRVNMDVIIFTTEPLIPTQETARLFRRTGHYEPYTPTDRGDWYEVPMEMDDSSDGILDRLHPTPAPIGNDQGSVLRRNGDHFEYPDGRHFHMWGLSVPTAPPKQDAEYLAKRLRRLGVTVARFHSLDGGLCNINSGKNYQLDETKLDRMEYFISCLKREGIYALIDPLYNWQAPMLGKADGLPEDAMIRGRIKVQFYIDPYLQQLNRDFIRKILTHRNPYTGMINGEDPAVAFFHIVNENSIFLRQLDAMEGSEHWAGMLTEQFNKWLIEEYGSRQKLARAWSNELKPGEDPVEGTVERTDPWHIRGPGQRASDNARFLYDVEVDFYNSVKDYVTKELKFDHILFNGSGWFGTGWLDTLDIAANLHGMDFFDQHGYGKVRSTILRAGNDQMLQRWPHYSLIERFASRAPAGYPMTVSEWNNGNKPAGPMMMACYGALNGWDGLFQYFTKFWFDGWRDGARPNAQVYLQYPMASLAFVRRYVSEADVAWRYVTPPDRLFDATRTENPHNTPICGMYPLLGKCEWVFNQEAEPVQVDAFRYEKQNGDLVESTTGEIQYYRPIGQMRIRADKLQGLVGEADGTAVDLGDVQMTLKDTGELSVCVAAADDRPLAQSRRMLLCAVGVTKALKERPAFIETFDAATTPAGWGAGDFLGKRGVNYSFKQAKRGSIGAGAAIALKARGEGQLAAVLPLGTQSLGFQYKPLESGVVQLEVLLDGKVHHVTEKEGIEVAETRQDPRLYSSTVESLRDVNIRGMNWRHAGPGAKIAIRTTGDCEVPVLIDNLQLRPIPDETLGDQLVMRPPVGDVAFRTPVKAVYALNLSGQRKAQVELENGTTFRLDNTHRTPWFEIVR